eukprot:TRINITY_DN5314_c0_g1_i2.p1 TRINITY_DN5314_c0_g1~~TRINITY_DN5314_c0_g1_i2.p1  ORF type:complete len:1870 (+),score=322.07 TRINITY_DN5314_c0_g1_i2:319-5610(+)
MPMPMFTDMPMSMFTPMPMFMPMPMYMPPDMAWFHLGNMTGNSSCLDTDGLGTDMSGNGCEWYESSAFDCGNLDDSDFSAKEMCCACKTCPSDCLRYWIGDKYCDAQCNVAECGFDGGDCDGVVNCDTYCWVNQYSEEGFVIGSESACGTLEGCPCNEQWEEQCDSFGYKYCVAMSEGCPKPTVVQCDDATEHTCAGEFGDSYCWMKEWGDCPITCAWDEQVCHSYAYDSAGNYDWSLPYTESCAPMDSTCPCNSEWENQCTDSWGFTSCQPKIYGCPVYCTEEQQYCYSTAFDSDGHPDWSKPSNTTCQSLGEHCPCDPVYEEMCQDEWGYSWCNVKVYGSCPKTCAAHEHKCWITPYDQNGDVDWSASWTEVCANITDGCPCHQTWERQCTGSYGKYCMSVSDNCPITCPAEYCYHYISGNESCAGATGCTCESNELTCTSDTGLNECYPSEWYGTCPLVCNWQTEMACWIVGFSSTNELAWTDYCYPQSDDWMCPVLCDNATAKKCGTGWNAYCVPITDDCPQECFEQVCWVDNYDTQGWWVDGEEVCVSWQEECPCGTNQTRCTLWDGSSFCESISYGCPASCNPATEKSCYIDSFTVDGHYDWDAPVNQSCVAAGTTCPCGANAKMCKWYDEFWGEDVEECYATSWSCPVSCSKNQSVCYLTEYNASGYPLSYLEKCESKGQPCPCGQNSQSCWDPWYKEHYCYPLWDFWSDRKLDCPVYCTADQDYCYVPSFDADGEQIDTTEYCVPAGQRCDCSKGQNAFECNLTDSWDPSFVYSVCLAAGSFCPSTCGEGEIACGQVEDFLPDGTSVGFAPPKKACAASVADCGCGKEAVRCGDSGCFSKDEGCPVTCEAGRKKCFLEDFDVNGSFISDREVCIAANVTCPCGKNTVKCPGQNVCVKQAEVSTICPCKEAEKECMVQDYDGSGNRLGFPRSVCTPKGGQCPCGDGTFKCSDGKCIPKYVGAVLNKCPKPCEDGGVSGNETCIQTNLDKEGNFVSKTVTCVASGTCKPGKNQIKCPSGAVVPTSSGCKDLYPSANRTRDKSKKQTSEIIVTLSDTKKDAAGKVDSVGAGFAGVVQAPGIDSTVTVKTGSSSSARRLQQSSSAKVVIKIEETGSGGSVSPQDVAEVAKSKVRSKSPDMLKALSSLGNVDAAAGVSIATTEEVVVDRKTASAQQIQKGLIVAGIIKTTTTTSKAATCETFTCPSGTKLSSSRADSTRLTLRECCDGTCAIFQCPANFRRDVSKADSTTLTAEECCERIPETTSTTLAPESSTEQSGADATTTRITDGEAGHTSTEAAVAATTKKPEPEEEETPGTTSAAAPGDEKPGTSTAAAPGDEKPGTTTAAESGEENPGTTTAAGDKVGTTTVAGAGEGAPGTTMAEGEKVGTTTVAKAGEGEGVPGTSTAEGEKVGTTTVAEAGEEKPGTSTAEGDKVGTTTVAGAGEGAPGTTTAEGEKVGTTTVAEAGEGVPGTSTAEGEKVGTTSVAEAGEEAPGTTTVAEAGDEENPGTTTEAESDKFQVTSFTAKLEMSDVTQFDEAAYVKAMAATSGLNAENVEVESVDYFVEVGYSVSTEVTIEQAKQLVASAVGVDTSRISVDVTPARRLARRLANYKVDATIRAQEASEVSAIASTAGNTAAVADALSTMNIDATIELAVEPKKKVQVNTKLKSALGATEQVSAPSTDELASSLKAEMGVEVQAEVSQVKFTQGSLVTPKPANPETENTDPTFTEDETAGSCNWSLLLPALLAVLALTGKQRSA